MGLPVIAVGKEDTAAWGHLQPCDHRPFQVKQVEPAISEEKM